VLWDLPERHDAASVAQAVIRECGTCPNTCADRSAGSELADYASVQLA
jgi:hypothetical protein